MDAISMFLAFVAHMNFIIYHMDVKSTFLNGEIEEEVYIEQPYGFKILDDPDMVCKLKNALYGLKKAPKSWYARLDRYLMH